MADLDLFKLLTAVGSAVKEAQLELETSHLGHYLRHFEQVEDENGPVLKPKMVRIEVPQPGGGVKLLSVPVVALVRHHALSLEQVTVRLAVTPAIDAETGHIRAALAPQAKLPTDAPDAQDAKPPRQEIELVFKRDDTPEGLARLSDEATRLI